MEFLRARALYLVAAMLPVLVNTEPAHAAAPYSAIYVFGTSLSDSGNTYASSLAFYGISGAVPTTPYLNGRFTNGSNWVEHLSFMLGNGPLTPSFNGGTNYAYGGAQTGATAVTFNSMISVDLQSQLAAFTATHATAPSTALYTLDIGGDDLFAIVAQFESTHAATPTLALSELNAAAASAASFVTTLHTMGATKLVIFGVPDLGIAPAFNITPPYAAAATYAAEYFNAALLADLAPVRAAGMSIYFLDEAKTWNAIAANPSAYNFSNATTPCYTGNVAGPPGPIPPTLCATDLAAQNQYFFYDNIHPTEAAQSLFARDALLMLMATTCPTTP